MEGTLEEGRKEEAGGVLVVGYRRIARFKAGKAPEDMLRSTRRFAMLEDTKGPEICLDTRRTERLLLGSRRGLRSTSGRAVL
jgi:hypothetical protein